MFLEHFDLAVNPFGMAPRLDFLFRSTAFQESMAHLIYGLDNSEAIVLITGPIGSGKTMSIQSFLTDLGEQYHSALVTNTQVTHIELLKLILEDLDIELGEKWDKSDLLIAFKNYLVKARQEGRKVVVIIDEAQNLSNEVLEEVRLLTNLGQGDEQPVQLILVGQPELKDLVNQSELAQLRQRIRVHYEFETLNFDEMVGYVNHRMEVAGCSRQVFEPLALKKLFEISGGIPRVINTHAGDALLSAYVAKRSKVSEKDIEEGVNKLADGEQRVTKVVTNEPSDNSKMTFPTGKTHEDPVYSARPREKASRFRWLWILFAMLVFFGPVAWYFGFRDEHLSLGKEVSLPPAVVSPVNNDSVLVVNNQISELNGDSIPRFNKTMVAGAEAVSPTQIVAETFFFTHVASFQDSARSHVGLKRLESLSYSGRIEKQIVDGEHWYRLYVGPASTQEAADLVGQRLRRDGEVDYFRVVKLPADIGAGFDSPYSGSPVAQ